MEKTKRTQIEDTLTFQTQETNQLLKTIIQAIGEKHADYVVSLNLRKVHEAISDFLIICEVKNKVQLNVLFEHIERKVWEKLGEDPYHREQGEGWNILDYVTIVVHIFREEERKFYDLEGLWIDGERTVHGSS